MPSLEELAKGTVAATAGISTIDVTNPSHYGLSYHDLELQAEDGVKLRCYLMVQAKDIPQPSATKVPDRCKDYSDEQYAAECPTVLMFHGNGGNIGHRIPLAKVFFVNFRCNVLMVSYRGYGLSEGSPSEKGIKMDAQCALDYVKSHPTLSQGPTLLYGQSIGGAVSIDLASRNPLGINALILENTFLSLPRLVPSALPVLGPFAFLCHQKWDSASKIPLIPRSIPILMLSGLQDEVVPKEHMQGLWEIVDKRENNVIPSAESVDKARVAAVDPRSLSKIVLFEKGTHNDTCVQQGYWTTIAAFVANFIPQDAPTGQT
ncbi:hypothetical protein NLI96_g5737 [Meripilus lineatus]|uniref:AB hydrolase-1 domain-containing protein n=1 Tax=Meripilus lineatus TaxID=2056292 RepID=A0AAD5V2B1_9APHY|nr:hypothetical protein NLI96_g5737 [Physisporinus lineatus]